MMKNAFLSLVKLGIGKTVTDLPKSFDWKALYTLAGEQGLTAIVIDGIERLPDNLRPPKDLMLQWIGEVLQSYEYRYVDYENAIGDLSGFYHRHGIKMMLLKGYGLSLNYPKPKHRPCGDIDIWQFGQQKAADAALAASSKFQVSGSRIDNSHHHHTVFENQGDRNFHTLTIHQ